MSLGVPRRRWLWISPDVSTEMSDGAREIGKIVHGVIRSMSDMMSGDGEAAKLVGEKLTSDKTPAMLYIAHIIRMKPTHA